MPERFLDPFYEVTLRGLARPREVDLFGVWWLTLAKVDRVDFAGLGVQPHRPFTIAQDAYATGLGRDGS
jgi:hypothetical protein